MPCLVLVRHGESVYNKQNRFTGGLDINLSSLGREEAKKSAEKLKGFRFDVAYTSDLKRAIKTFDIIMKFTKHPKIPVKKDKALNERDYGKLVGMNKDEARKKYGAEQVHVWRRSYDTRPPDGESLKDTAKRVLSYFNKNILKEIKEGKNILVSAHGNTLRAIVMKLDKLNKDQVINLEIPTGTTIFYQMDNQGKVVSKKML